MLQMDSSSLARRLTLEFETYMKEGKMAIDLCQCTFYGIFIDLKKSAIELPYEV
jgi:hypothetical protein